MGSAATWLAARGEIRVAMGVTTRPGQDLPIIPAPATRTGKNERRMFVARLKESGLVRSGKKKRGWMGLGRP